MVSVQQAFTPYHQSMYAHIACCALFCLLHSVSGTYYCFFPRTLSVVEFCVVGHNVSASYLVFCCLLLCIHVLFPYFLCLCLFIFLDFPCPCSFCNKRFLLITYITSLYH